MDSNPDNSLSYTLAFISLIRTKISCHEYIWISYLDKLRAFEKKREHYSVS